MKSLWCLQRSIRVRAQDTEQSVDVDKLVKDLQDKVCFFRWTAEWESSCWR
jgi:hypothetical protein